jgi:hypothetical protein
VIWRRTIHWKWRALVVVGTLSVAVIIAVPNSASAQGFFDFLFGGSQQRAPSEPSAYPPPPAPLGRVAPAPLGQENVTNEGGGSTGHAVVFCVRLCDGQHFPMEKMANVTAAETCRAICPYSRTKVFLGSEIGGAVAQDGQHYANLDTAFAYRKQMVANCTCNGRDGFGLTSFDVKKDPTLRPGDIISTKEGLLAYTGKSGQDATFTPVNPATLPANITGSSQSRLPPTVDPVTDNTPGTGAQPQKRQPQNTPPALDSQGHPAR